MVYRPQRPRRLARRKVGTLAACAALSAALSAALTTGVGASTRAHKGSQKRTTLNLAEVPFYEYAATWLGQRVGIFRHYGINVVLKPASNVNIILAELHSNQDQIGFTSTALLISADEAGQGVKCIAPLETINEPDPAYPANALMVAPNSPITSIKQLDGKTVALNQPAGSNQLFLKAAVEQAGGNYSSINITVVPFADMPAALKSGAVDAAFEVPPFIQTGEKAGDQKMLKDLDYLTAGLTPDCWMATDSYIAHHKGLLTRFVQAQDQSILYAAQHKTAANNQIPYVSGLPASEALAAVPPKLVYGDDLAPSTIVKYEQFMSRYGALKGKVLPLDQVAWVAKGTPMNKLYFASNGRYIGPANG
jgi:NitT/TauT family transport system substrate-binding protein